MCVDGSVLELAGAAHVAGQWTSEMDRQTEAKEMVL